MSQGRNFWIGIVQTPSYSWAVQGVLEADTTRPVLLTVEGVIDVVGTTGLHVQIRTGIDGTAVSTPQIRIGEISCRNLTKLGLA